MNSSASWCLAALIVLIIVLAACLCAGPASKEGFHRLNNRLWPTALTGYYWHRDPWPPQGPRRRPPMWWWRYPGYAAPLELSLPLQNYYDYLHGYPPSSRMPYNA